MAFYLTHGAQKRAERKQNNKKSKTSFGTKVVVFFMAMFFIGLAASKLAPPESQSVTQVVITKPAIEKAVAAKKVTAKKRAVKLSKWVEPKIYPGVKLYYSHNGTRMKYIGTIFDAVSRTINGERCFGIRMASGSMEYKHRNMLWNGHWFMDREQGQEAIDKFNEEY